MVDGQNRVYELAKSQNLEAKHLIKLCQDEGMEHITHPFRYVTQDDAENINYMLSRRRQEGTLPVSQDDREAGEKSVAIYEIAASLDADIDGGALVKLCREAGLSHIEHHSQKVSEDDAEDIKDIAMEQYEKEKSAPDAKGEAENKVQIYEIAKDLDLEIDGGQVVEICRDAGMEHIKHHLEYVPREEAEEIKQRVNENYEKYMAAGKEDEDEKVPVHKIARSIKEDLGDRGFSGKKLVDLCQEAGLKQLKHITHHAQTVGKNEVGKIKKTVLGLYRRKIRKEEAGRAAGTQVRTPDSHAEARYKEGNRLMDDGKYEKAVEAFNRSIELDPQNFRAWSSKAIALTKIAVARKDLAVGTIDQAMAMQDDEHTPLLNILVEEARFAAKRALDIKPKDNRLRDNLQDLLKSFDE